MGREPPASACFRFFAKIQNTRLSICCQEEAKSRREAPRRARGGADAPQLMLKATFSGLVPARHPARTKGRNRSTPDV